MGSGCTSVKDDSTRFAMKNENYKNKLNPTEPMSKWQAKMLRDVGLDTLAVVRDFPRMLVSVTSQVNSNSEECANCNATHVANNTGFETNQNNRDNHSNINSNTEKITSFLSISNECTHSLHRRLPDNRKSFSDNNSRLFVNPLQVPQKFSVDEELAHSDNEHEVHKGKADANRCNSNIANGHNTFKQEEHHIEHVPENEHVYSGIIKQDNINKNNGNSENSSNKSLNGFNTMSKVNHLEQLRPPIEPEITKSDDNIYSPNAEQLLNNKAKIINNYKDKEVNQRKNTITHKKRENENKTHVILKDKRINNSTQPHRELTSFTTKTAHHLENGKLVTTSPSTRKNEVHTCNAVSSTKSDMAKLAERASRVKETILQLAKLCGESSEVITHFCNSWDGKEPETMSEKATHALSSLPTLTTTKATITTQLTINESEITSTESSKTLERQNNCNINNNDDEREARVRLKTQDIAQRLLDACVSSGMIERVKCTEHNSLTSVGNNAEEYRARSASDTKLFMNRFANSWRWHKRRENLSKQSRDDLYVHTKNCNDSNASEEEENSSTNINNDINSSNRDGNVFRPATSAPVWPQRYHVNYNYNTNRKSINRADKRQEKNYKEQQKHTLREHWDRLQNLTSMHFYAVRSATFHLMQFMTQDIIYFPLQRLKHILWMPWVNLWQDVRWVVCVREEYMKKSELDRERRLRWLRDLAIRPASMQDRNLYKEIYLELNIDNATDEDSVNNNNNNNNNNDNNNNVGRFETAAYNNNTESTNTAPTENDDNNKYISLKCKSCDNTSYSDNTVNLNTLLKMQPTNDTNDQMATVIVIEHVQTIRHCPNKRNRTTVPEYEVEWRCRIRINAAALKAAFHPFLHSAEVTEETKAQNDENDLQNASNISSTQTNRNHYNDNKNNNLSSNLATNTTTCNKSKEERCKNLQTSNSSANIKEDNKKVIANRNDEPLIELLPVPPEIVEKKATPRVDELFDKTVSNYNNLNLDRESFPTFKPKKQRSKRLEEQKRLERVIKSEVVSCDITVTKACIRRVKQAGLLSSSSFSLWKARVAELVYVLRRQYNVEPTYVTKLEEENTYI